MNGRKPGGLAFRAPMRDPAEAWPALRHGRLVWAGLGVSGVLTVLLGAFPGVLLELVGSAAAVVGP